jgi:hypothetical protein
VDLFFADCTVPPPHIVLRFFELVERTPGVIAVHCKVCAVLVRAPSRVEGFEGNDFGFRVRVQGCMGCI